MKLRARYLFLFILLFNAPSFGLSPRGAGGGPFLEYHLRDLSAFDPTVSGNPVVMGGMGLTPVGRQFLLGGGGGASFLLGGSSTVQFGMGYGGMIGVFQFASYLSARVLVGGGGFALVEVLSESETQRVVRKISSGGFIVFHPTLDFDFSLMRTTQCALSLGYFLPSVSDLAGVTISLRIQFGRG